MNDKDSGFKPKKSVALSGVVAGNTALSTVGRTGNDLHYRGYDILDIADKTDLFAGKVYATILPPVKWGVSPVLRTNDFEALDKTKTVKALELY